MPNHVLIPLVRGRQHVVADDEGKHVMSASNGNRGHAKATITVHKYEPVVYEQPTDGPALSRIHVEEGFAGDIEAPSVGGLAR
jgi:hypothetical protein